MGGSKKMFQTKRSSTEPNPTNLNTNTALPSNHGHIRTLKDDLANLTAEKKEEPVEPIPQLPEIPAPAPLRPPVPPRPAEIPLADQSKILAKPPAPERKIPLSNFSPAQKEKPAEAMGSKPKNGMPNPFGSETFFQTQSPFDEKVDVQKKESGKKIAKSSNKLSVILFSFFVLAVLAGGASYWWFFMRSPAKVSAPTTQIEKTPGSEAGTGQGSNLKQWVLDLEADKIANKLAIERYAKNLAGTAPEKKALEIKLVSKDNQPIAPQTFSGIFDFSFPASVSEKLTSDYSLFVTYENGDPHLGAAFKLTQSGNLAESLRSEEGSLFPGLKSFYLERLPADTRLTFNSSKYKNADIRYFNFSSPANISLDYTVLSGSSSSYFIFSNSKNSIRAILDYMSEK